MAKACFIAPGDSELSELIAGEHLRGGFRTVISTDSEPEEGEGIRSIPVVWNRRSPLGAKSVLRSVQSRVESLDRICLLFTPPHENRALHNLEAADIESTMDGRLKGMLYLLKEAVQFGMQNPALTIYCIVQSNDPALLSPVDRGIMEFYRGFLGSLLATYENEKFNFTVFDSTSSELEPFRDYLFTQIREKKDLDGRWMHYARKTGFLSRKR